MKALTEALLSPNCKVVKVNVLGQESFTSQLPGVLHDIEAKRGLAVLLSPRRIRRIGTRSALRKMPSDLFRKMAEMVKVGSSKDDLSAAFGDLVLADEDSDSSSGDGDEDYNEEDEEAEEAADDESKVWFGDDVHYDDEHDDDEHDDDDDVHYVPE